MNPTPANDGTRSKPSLAPDVSVRERVVGWTVLCGCALALLWPLFGALGDDSFPLSTYPMFTEHREQVTMHQLLGFDAQGAEHRLAPELFGTSEVLQAKALIDRAARSRKRRERLCQRVALQVAARDDYAQLERLQFLRVRFDPIAYFSEGREPLSSKRLHQCSVPSRAVKAAPVGEKP